jgi:arylsulfatase A-like enzyme
MGLLRIFRLRTIKLIVQLVFLFFVTFSCTIKPDTESKTDRPNIIFIKADDMGWGDPAYNGNSISKTPNLDKMASSGIVFNRFYASSPVCSPTGGSCITGRHPYRYRIFYANTGHMRDQEVTLAEVLKTKFYVTGNFGKWHLGTLTKTEKDANRGGRLKDTVNYTPPWENGFDVCFSTESKMPAWNPLDTPSKSAGDIRKRTEGEPFGTAYWTGPGQKAIDNLEGDDSHILMDRVIPFIDKAARSEKPFFSVIWFHTPHLPVLTSEKYKKL